MPSRNKLLESLKMPVGQDAKAKLDSFLQEQLNMPLAEAGYPNAGAALSALASATGELVIPDDIADAAIMFLPGAKLAKAGKGLKKLIPGLEKAGTIDYKAMKAADKAATKASEEGAGVLKYTGIDAFQAPNLRK